jgi:hypothetical protein
MGRGAYETTGIEKPPTIKSNTTKPNQLLVNKKNYERMTIRPKIKEHILCLLHIFSANFYETRVRVKE